MMFFHAMRRQTAFYCILLVIFSSRVFSTVSNGPFAGKIISVGISHDGVILASTEAGVYRSENSGGWNLITIGAKENLANCFLTTDENVFIAGTTRGAFRSADAGKTWNKISFSTSPCNVTALVRRNSNEVFLSTEEGQLFHSTDKGNHWLRIPLPQYNGRLQTLFVDAKGAIVVGTITGHIFSSDNGGVSWRTTHAPFKHFPLRSLIVTGDGKTIAASQGGGVVISSTHPSGWEKISGEFPTQVINTLYLKKDGAIVAGTDIGGVLESKDLGKNWFTHGLARHHASVITVDDQEHLIVGSERGLFRLLDDGLWNQIGAPAVSVTALSLINHDVLLAGTKEQGMFTSFNAGKSWVKTSKGISGNHVTAIAKLSGSVIAIGVLPVPPQKTSGGVHISVDTGKTWEQIGLINISISSIVSAGATILAGTDSGIYHSNNQGKTWTKMNSPRTRKRVTSLVCDSKGIIFAGTKSGLLKSLDNGSTWQQVEYFSGQAVTQLKISGALVVAMSTNGLFRSLDSGEQWEQIRANSASDKVIRMEIDPDGKLYYAATSGIYSSMNSGKTWEQMSLQCDGISLNTFIVDSGSSIIIGAEHQGVILPTNNKQ